jgi:hypothetical protein
MKKILLSLNTVAQICNPSYLGGWDWDRDSRSAQAKNKTKQQAWWYTPVIPVAQEA